MVKAERMDYVAGVTRTKGRLYDAPFTRSRAAGFCERQDVSQPYPERAGSQHHSGRHIGAMNGLSGQVNGIPPRGRGRARTFDRTGGAHSAAHVLFRLRGYAASASARVRYGGQDGGQVAPGDDKGARRLSRHTRRFSPDADSGLGIRDGDSGFGSGFGIRLGIRDERSGMRDCGAGYGDRNRLGGLSKLVMARDFWRQALHLQRVSTARTSTGVLAIPLSSPAFWRHSGHGDHSFTAQLICPRETLAGT